MYFGILASMSKKLIIPALVLLCLPLAAQQAQEPFVFMPQWTAQAQFAGFYVAQDLGFYQEEGIDVRIEHPSTSITVHDRVMSDRDRATTLQLAQALEIVDDGVELVNILQTSMNNGMVIVSRRDRDPMTQHGAKVGVWHAGFGQLAICMSNKEHLDYQWVGVLSNINLFVSGALDATLAMSYNEYYQLVQTGMELKEENVYRFCDHGYNIQEDGVYMSLDAYRRNNDKAERFARASRRGWEWAAGHPDETLDIVMKYVNESNIPTNRVLQRLMLEEILRLQMDRESGKQEFRLLPEHVALASSLMTEYGMLKKEITYQSLLPR